MLGAPTRTAAIIAAIPTLPLLGGGLAEILGGLTGRIIILSPLRPAFVLPSRP
jgi:hypothetical protein